MLLPSFLYTWLQLGVTLAIWLLSLLAVFLPLSNTLWKLSIVVQEGGHFLVFPCLLIAYLCFRSNASGILAGVLSITAALLFASPLCRALITAHRLDIQFKQGFGASVPSLPKPFRESAIQWKQLFLGIPILKSHSKKLVYQVKDKVSYALEFYPTTRVNAPCIVVVHGGGWDSGSRLDLDLLNEYLAANGYAVASLDYRLAPEHIYPAPIKDLDSVLAFLKRKEKELGIDTSRFVLLGRSAGAQIALQAAYLGGKSLGIKGVISYYGPADMVYGYSIPCNPAILDSRKIMVAYLGADFPKNPVPYSASSPIEYLTSDSPPTLSLHGHRDVMVAYEHTVRLEAKLSRLGVPHFTVDLPWATHGFDYIFSGPGSQLSLFYIERFLAKVTE